MKTWEIKEFIKQQFMQLKTNDGYRHLITRSYIDGEYIDKIEFIKKEDVPKDAKNIVNKGPKWFYVERDMNIDEHEESERDMTAISLNQWAENDRFTRALANVWNWTGNLNFKTIGLIAVGCVVAIIIFTMVKP